MRTAAPLTRPDLATTAEKLRRYAARWRALARSRKARPDEAPVRYLIAQAYEDAAELLEARQFKAELGAGIAPPKRGLAAKPKRVTRQDKVLALVATGPIGVHDVALALDLRSRSAYEELTELYRTGKITRREVRVTGRKGTPIEHLYYMP